MKVNSAKTLDGFLNVLNDQVEGALLLVGDAAAFLAATQVIEKLLAEDWPALETDLRGENLSAENRQRLLRVLESINALETKTRARLAWSEDFEVHMRRAMEKTS